MARLVDYVLIGFVYLVLNHQGKVGVLDGYFVRPLHLAFLADLELSLRLMEGVVEIIQQVQ